MPFLNKSEMRILFQNFSNLIFLNTVFANYLIDDLIKPNKLLNLQL